MTNDNPGAPMNTSLTFRRPRKRPDPSAEDIARASHAHPSLSEAVKQAALAAGSGTTQL